MVVPRVWRKTRSAYIHKT